MVFNWKEFKIDLKSFYEYLQQHVPNACGIVAFNSHFEIPSYTSFTQQEMDLINSYYDNLNKHSEDQKSQKPFFIHQALVDLKKGMLLKKFDELNTIEKKILLNIELSQEEIESLLT